MAAHDVVRLIIIAVPTLVLVSTLLWLRTLRVPDISGSMSNLETLRFETQQRLAENKAFQDQGLAELKRHNTLMEQQTVLLSRLINREQPSNSAERQI